MTEFYSKSYNYNHFEIDVVKRNEYVIVSCLDKQLHKSYQETFTQEIIFNMFGINNLNNFVTIIKYSFDSETITIVDEHEKLNFEINYNKEDLMFKFNFLLMQVEQTQLNSNSVYIKKLEGCIAELEGHIEKLEEYNNKCVEELKRRDDELEKCNVCECWGILSKFISIFHSCAN
jgi:hypothetical protein